MRDCAVILVNYRQPALTEQTVASLRKADGFVRLAVYVIDNGSGDGSYERLRKSCADCIVLSTGSNLGFSGGNNVGVRAALESGVKWVLLLNNDTEVEPKFLEPLMSAVSDGRSLATARMHPIRNDFGTEAVLSIAGAAGFIMKRMMLWRQFRAPLNSPAGAVC